MTPEDRTIDMAVGHITARGVSGDIVECGVGEGDRILQFIRSLDARSQVRRIWLADTFSGMTEPGKYDRKTDGSLTVHDVRGKWERANGTWANTPVDVVKSRVLATGYPPERLRFVVGDVRQTLQRHRPEAVAILRLDTDFYDSTLVELEYLYQRVSPGGIVIIDDYGAWDGQKKAVDDYFGGSCPEMIATCRKERYFVKPVLEAK